MTVMGNAGLTYSRIAMLCVVGVRVSTDERLGGLVLTDNPGWSDEFDRTVKRLVPVASNSHWRARRRKNADEYLGGRCPRTRKPRHGRARPTVWSMLID